MSFNPSIAQAPVGLCARCRYVATLRLDSLHQCDRSSPLLDPKAQKTQSAANAWFHGTALALLDEELQVIAWTWLVNAPKGQMAPNRAEERRWFIKPGVSDGFLPPWTKQVYDTRLFNLGGRLFASYNCRGCSYSVSLVHVTATQTADGGVTELRAWCASKLRKSAAFETECHPPTHAYRSRRSLLAQSRELHTHRKTHTQEDTQRTNPPLSRRNAPPNGPPAGARSASPTPVRTRAGRRVATRPSSPTRVS